MTDTRTYIRVHDGMTDHPKIEGLSDRAFRLLIETWCWCSRHLTDGSMPRHLWDRRGTKKTRHELITAGLISMANDRVVAHDYLEHQRSAVQVAEVRATKRRAGTLGNHNRWHKARGINDPACPYCADDPDDGSHMASQNGSHMRSQERSQRDRTRSPVSETEKELLADLDGGGGSVGRREDQPPPLQCPQHEDTDHDAPCRACRDARIRREDWERIGTATARLASRAAAHRQAEAKRAAVAACDLCDPAGYRGRLICDHDPTAQLRAAAGLAAVRAALTKEAS